MIAGKHIQFVVVSIGCLIAVLVGSNIVLLPPAGLAIVLAGIFVVAWMTLAGENWWVPVLPAGAILGTFYVGIKVYPGEVGLALAVIGLVPLVLAQDKEAFQYQRKPLPILFYVCGLYSVIRLLIDVIPAEGYRGNLSRAMFSYTAGFLFVILFHHYGSFKATRTAIIVLFVAVFLRTFAAIVGYFASTPLYIPGINYVLSFSSGDSLTQMRAVAISLMMATIILFNANRSWLIKLMLLPVFAYAAVMVLLGAGRFQTLVMLSLPIAFFAWSRNWFLLLATMIVGFGTIAFVNVDPQSLAALPPSAGRALSGLVFTTNASQSDFATYSSDQWHDAMRAEGLRRLTESPLNFLFGDGFTPSPELAETLIVQRDWKEIIESAANIGAYESGLWSVLGVLGVVGFGLYLALFITLWKTTIPYFLRRPRGTYWEGFVFWGVYGSVLWFPICYFEGGPPVSEMVILILAWDLVHDGKLDEDATISAPTVPFASTVSFPKPLPVHSRG